MRGNQRCIDLIDGMLRTGRPMALPDLPEEFDPVGATAGAPRPQARRRQAAVLRDRFGLAGGAGGAAGRLRPSPDLLRELLSLGGVVRRHHRIVGGKSPLSRYCSGVRP